MHSLFVKNDNSVWVCGRNNSGQLGDGTNINKLTPIQLTSISGVFDVSGGLQHSIFLKTDGTVWATGANFDGRLGDGTLVDKTSPVQITSLSNIVQISAGYFHSLFLKNDGVLYVCGEASSGQLGRGDYTVQQTPVNIESLCAVQVTSIEDKSLEARFKIYPTVSSGIYTIEGGGKEDLLSVYDVQGQIIHTSELHNFPSIIDLSSSANGIYFVQIKSENSI